MKYINYYFVGILVYKFLIIYIIYVFFYYISLKENCFEYICVISVMCLERWYFSNIIRNKFWGKYLF